jgi:hypothetical protein
VPPIDALAAHCLAPTPPVLGAPRIRSRRAPLETPTGSWRTTGDSCPALFVGRLDEVDWSYTSKDGDHAASRPVGTACRACASWLATSSSSSRTVVALVRRRGGSWARRRRGPLRPRQHCRSIGARQLSSFAALQWIVGLADHASAEGPAWSSGTRPATGPCCKAPAGRWPVEPVVMAEQVCSLSSPLMTIVGRSTRVRPDRRLDGVPAAGERQFSSHISSHQLRRRRPF